MSFMCTIPKIFQPRSSHGKIVEAYIFVLKMRASIYLSDQLIPILHVIISSIRETLNKDFWKNKLLLIKWLMDLNFPGQKHIK